MTDTITVRSVAYAIYRYFYGPDGSHSFYDKSFAEIETQVKKAYDLGFKDGKEALEGGK